MIRAARRQLKVTHYTGSLEANVSDTLLQFLSSV